MRKLLRATTALLLASSFCSASEEAKELLKVPPAEARDEPAVEGAKEPASPGQAAAATPAEPSPAPSDPAPPVPEEAADAGADEEIVPAPHPVSRYALLWEKSPFQTESVAPPVQSAGLGERFALAGILRENGEFLVWVRERATQQSYKVDKKSPNALGLSLVEVAESPERQSEASATVRLGAEIGVIKFDNTGAAPGAPPVAAPFVPQPPGQAMRQFPQPPRPGVPVPQPGQPGMANVAVPQAAPAVNPAVAAPGVVPPVPGPGIPSDGQVAPGEGQAMPPPRVIRRRAIVPAAP